MRSTAICVLDLGVAFCEPDTPTVTWSSSASTLKGAGQAPSCEGADHDPRGDPEESPQCRSTSAIGSGRVKSGPLGISAGSGMTSAVVLSTAELKAHRAATRIFGNRHAGIAMNASPDFAEPRTVQTAGPPVAPASAEINGNRYDNFVNAKEPSAERRRRPSPSTTDEYLHALPALILLDRLPIPMLATGLDGVLIYANPAFATMLGHPGPTTLTEQPLPALLAGYSATPPRDCVTALRDAAGTVVIDWLHAEGFAVRTVVSNPLLLRATDPILLISITDITELMWTS